MPPLRGRRSSSRTSSAQALEAAEKGGGVGGEAEEQDDLRLVGRLAERLYVLHQKEDLRSELDGGL